MKYRNMFRKYMQEAGTDGGDGGNGGGEPPKTYSEADIAGLKSKNGEVIGENKALKQQLQDAQAFAKQFEGLDVDFLKNLAAKAKQDEEAALLAKGDVDQVIERRLAMRNAEVEKTLAAKDAELEAYRTKEAAWRQDKVGAELTKQAVALGALPEAVSDLLGLYGGKFTVDESGAVVAAEGTLGKDGKTPLTAAELLADLRESKPYFFAKPSGGAAIGSGSKNTATTNPFAKESWNLTEQAKLQTQNPALAKQLAAQAGAKIY